MSGLILAINGQYACVYVFVYPSPSYFNHSNGLFFSAIFVTIDDEAHTHTLLLLLLLLLMMYQQQLQTPTMSILFSKRQDNNNRKIFQFLALNTKDRQTDRQTNRLAVSSDVRCESLHKIEGRKEKERAKWNVCAKMENCRMLCMWRQHKRMLISISVPINYIPISINHR